jgi:hypothetical protein
MIDKVLVMKNATIGRTIAVKSIISAGLIVLAVLLPQLVHLALGQPGGVRFLPMYLPILIGGCLLGTRWALMVGILSPVVSFLLTSLGGAPMPAAPRLPFMILELAVFAAISGLFTKKIVSNGLWAFPAVFCAQAAGRLVFLGAIALTQSFTTFTTGMILGQIVTGIPGIIIQLVLAPVIMIGLRALLIADKENE